MTSYLAKLLTKSKLALHRYLGTPWNMAEDPA